MKKVNLVLYFLLVKYSELEWLWMQEAVLVNASRGPVIDEAALVEHLKANPMFRVGLDVFEVIMQCKGQLAPDWWRCQLN